MKRRLLIGVLIVLVISVFVLAEDKGKKEHKITICHFPPGNPDNVRTISIDESALEAHLAHGDTLGDCSGYTDGDTRQCGSTDVGACSFGVETYKNGRWGKCEGAIYPDIEVCDRKDNDCDGAVDNGIEARSCGSNEGVCVEGSQECIEGSWGKCSGNYVGPSEETCNGVDDNCDGEIDEGNICACENGATRSCGSDTGICESGVQSCRLGKWGECKDAREAEEEVCDGLDNDCDGAIDEQLTQACGEFFVGTCAFGEQTCNAGAWGACTGVVNPSQEVCDNEDNDCDGRTDESLARVFGSDVGICSSGEETCVAGVWWISEEGVEPTEEICEDGLDNDCDNAIDEACIEACIPSEEVCDGLDNDCDGMIDEDVVRNCGSDVGICSFGEQACSRGVWGACVGGVAPAGEICNNVDDNCDGMIDEEVSQACGSDVGECSKGVQACSDSVWSVCAGAIRPIEEVCDGLDNDCDGLIDNGVECGCAEGEIQSCGEDEGACTAGTQTCVDGAWNECSGVIEATVEICDGLDNDCNGEIDEELIEACGESDIGACSFGVRSCVDGNWGICEGEITAAVELCDGLDNDCDDLIDESLIQDCGETNESICAFGVQTCVEGNWGVCEGSIDPIAEVCGDGIDNDCDNAVDEGCAAPSSGGGGGGGRRSPQASRDIPQPLNLPSCFKNDGCVYGCVPTDLDCPKQDVDITIVHAPVKVDIVDDQFVIEVIVENTGNVNVHQLGVTSGEIDGWKGKPVFLGSLKPGEKKAVVIEVESELCTKENKREESYTQKELKVKLSVVDETITWDSETAKLVLNIPKLAVTTAKTDYATDNVMTTCFFVNNFDQAERTKLEIEFEAFDAKNELIVDFISPITVQANETLIKRQDYKLRYVPRNKEYKLRASLFENGTLFSGGYSVGKGDAGVDLSEYKKQKLDFIKWLKSLFR